MNDEVIRLMMETWGYSREEAVRELPEALRRAVEPVERIPQHDDQDEDEGQPDLVRRGIVGLAWAGISSAYAARTVVFKGALSGALGTALYEGTTAAGRAWRETHADHSLSPTLVNLINENWGKSDLLALLPSDTPEDGKIFARAVVDFAKGLPIGPQAYQVTHNLAFFSHDNSARLQAVDLLTGDLVRGGASSEADRVFNANIKFGDASENAADMLAYAEKQFSFSYTQTDPADDLIPRKWGFEKALSKLSKLDLVGTGLNIVEGEHGHHVIYAGGFDLKRIDLPIDGKAFYALAWALLYWAASQEPADSKQTAEEQINILNQFIVRDDRFRRPVWNMAYIIGQYYNKLSKSTDNAGDARAQRDRLFDICLSRAPKFPTDFDRVSQKSINANEMIPISMALTLRGDPDFRNYNFGNLVTLAFLAELAPAVRPITLRRSIDKIRKGLGEPPTAHAISDLHVGRKDDNSLSIYLPPVFQAIDPA